MVLSENDKKDLENCLSTSKNFFILTTGRAGSDFLQSCFDNHEEVASTSEKCTYLSSFIKKNKVLLPKSITLFSALSTSELYNSFAPYVDHIENWVINENDDYRKAKVSRFIEAMTYLLNLKKNDYSYLTITRIIILSFSFSLKKNIKKIKTILIHLHNINQLPFFQKDFNKSDLIVVCSRSPYDLVASGVFHWRKYWIKNKQYSHYLNHMQYRYTLRRTLFDFLEIKKIYNIPEPLPYITILEKLSDLDYLNKINKYLLIKPFSVYPNSTVLGKKWGGDLLSTDNKISPSGTYDPNLVKRGNPIERLGLVDSILITLICKERLENYEFKTGSQFLKQIKNTNTFLRLLFFLVLLPFPSKIELLHYSKIIEIFIKIILCKKLSKIEKVSQLGYSIFCVLMMPIEYVRMRIFRISALFWHLKSPKFLEEL